MVLPKTVVSRYGYGILKTELSTKDIRKIKKMLTVRAFVPPGAPVKPDPFSVFMESPKRLWVPREWGREQFGEPDHVRISQGEDRKEQLKFNGSLREKQIGIVGDWVKKVVPSTTPESRILTVPCGYGKTIMSLWCASQVGKKTLVVVHKEFLMNQFRSEIRKFLPNARIGRIQGSVCDVEDKDIVIGMLQSLVSKDYPSSIFESFGMVIFDECHHLAAEVFSRVLTFLGCWRMLGLSATPDRKDRLSKVFHWYLGSYLAKIEDRGKEDLHVHRITHTPEGTEDEIEEYLCEPLTASEHVNSPRLITRICENYSRNSLILHIIVRMIQSEKRRVLILSDRRDQLRWIFQEASGVLDGDCGYYVGGMKEDALNQSAQKSLVLGTYAMASEGMNVPELNTLILASPKSDITQSVGRILRKKAEDREKTPLVIDIIDKHPSLVRQSKKRVTFYNKNKYTLMDGKWDRQKGFVQSLQKKKRRKPVKNVCEIFDD
jgi:superfamily II DNA or RNA helicase